MMKRHIILTALLTALIILALPFHLQAQTHAPKPPPPTIRVVQLGNAAGSTSDSVEGLTPQQKLRWETFFKVWSTLDLSYFDKTYNGLDWNKVKAEYKPRVIAAKSDSELYRLLNEMIGKLNRSHFAVIPPEVFAALESARHEVKKRGAAGVRKDVPEGAAEPDPEDKDLYDEHSRYGIGVDLRMIEDRFVVTYVDPRSAAQLAGIKRGYIVDKINGVSLSDMIRRIVFSYPDMKNLHRYLPIEVVSWFLNGERDSNVVVTCLDEKDQPKEFSMKRMLLDGSAVPVAPSFPPVFLAFESRSLDETTGYVRFNLFSIAVLEKFCNALGEFRDKKALVIDLRGNLGGLLAVLSSLSGMLTDHEMNFGTSIYRSTTDPFEVKPRARHFSGRVVLLVDNQSVSAAEIFASGLRENDRVLIVGSTTAGEALPAAVIELPTGARFMFPVANFKSRLGKLIEGSGVEPDFAVPLDRKELLDNIDAPLDKALALIREDKQFPAQKEIRHDRIVDVTRLSAADGEAPPPPSKKLQVLGKGSGLLSAPAPLASPEIKEQKALNVIADFLKVLNADEYRSVKSYEAVGVGDVGSLGGGRTRMDLKAYKQSPDKFAFVVQTESVGEFREVYTGSSRFVESDIGYQKEIPPSPASYESDLFGPITMLLDTDKFNYLKYLGAFDRDGRQCNIIEGKFGYTPVTFVFDVETKMLVSFVAYGSPTVFGDYRKVNGMMLPFHVAVERVFDVNLSEIKINVPVDEAHFQHKKNCFDLPLDATAK